MLVHVTRPIVLSLYPLCMPWKGFCLLHERAAILYDCMTSISSRCHGRQFGTIFSILISAYLRLCGPCGVCYGHSLVEDCDCYVSLGFHLFPRTEPRIIRCFWIGWRCREGQRDVWFQFKHKQFLFCLLVGVLMAMRWEHGIKYGKGFSKPSLVSFNRLLGLWHERLFFKGRVYFARNVIFRGRVYICFGVSWNLYSHLFVGSKTLWYLWDTCYSMLGKLRTTYSIDFLVYYIVYT